MRRRAAAVAGATIAAATAWAVRHLTAPAVAAWSPPTTELRRGASLSFRTSHRRDAGGSDSPRTLLLLHGLGASGRYYGSLYDDVDGIDAVVAPDLLGFGPDRDRGRTDHSLVAHLDALDAVVDEAVPPDHRIVVVAHSMGTAVALGFAGRHRDRVERVACVGPPIYPSATAAGDDAASHAGMARLLLAESDWAERLCRVNCANPEAMGWLLAACAPTLPIPIGRDASLHTWSSMDGSIRSLVLDTDWDELFDVDVPIVLVRGTDDDIGDVEAIERFVDGDRVRFHRVDGADHHLAITRSGLVHGVVTGDPEPFASATDG